MVTQENGEAEILDIGDVSGRTCSEPSKMPLAAHSTEAGAYVDGQLIQCNIVFCHEYVFDTQKWERLLTLELAVEPAAVLVDETQWWIASEDKSFVYVGNATFVPGPALPEYLYGHCAVKVNETHVFVAGGDVYM